MEGRPEERSGRERDAAEEAVREYAALLEAGDAPDPASFLAARPHVAERVRGRILHLHAGHAAIAEHAESSASGGAGASEPSAPPPRSPPVVTRLGDFRILREIGRGGMGVVYLAEQVSLQRTVALKVLPSHLTLLPEAVERFRREASTAARLRHPGIVEIHAIGEEAGAHYFAMEFVEGTPLDKVVERLREESPELLDGARVGAAVSDAAHRKVGAAPDVPGVQKPKARVAPSSAWNKTYIETVCRLVAHVADALEHAHKAGVLHRDVKPSNILVREDGSPVVTDFGLAREEGLPSLTQTGDFAGTPYYVSPEQAMARRIPVDHRSDIFSLGVTLYELLTLRRPFEGRSSQEVLAKIIAKEPASPRRFNPLLPRDLATIVLKAIEKDPDRRYASAAAFAADLRAFLSFRPIEARPASIPTRALKFLRRHRVEGAAAGILCAGLAGVAAWWWLQPGRLSVTSPTIGATVFVDGEVRGVTPLEIALTPGLHRVRLRREEEDLEMFDEEEVLVERGRIRHYDRQLPSRSGVLRLESDPPGAGVTLLAEDGGERGVEQRTPVLYAAPAGRYRARFELEGFPPREEEAVVRRGGATTSCSTSWETASLDLRGWVEGMQVDIHRGPRLAKDPPVKTVTLPLADPLHLPPGTYSFRAWAREHDRSDREGIRLASGETTTLWIGAPPLMRRFDLRLGGDHCYSSIVQDLDGDGLPEIAAGGDSPRVRIFSAQGRPVLDLETDAEVGVLLAADLDGDGEPELLAGTRAGSLFAFAADGSPRLHAEAPGRVQCLAVADLDGDGRPEIVAGTGTPGAQVLAFAADGARRFASAEFPQGIGFASHLGSHRGGGEDLVVSDLDGDGRSEVVTASGRTLLVLRDDGSLAWSKETGDWWITGLAAADLDGKGAKEVLAATQSSINRPSPGQLLAFGADGSLLFEQPQADTPYALVVSDLDNDGRPVIVTGSSSGRIAAVRADRSSVFQAEAGEIVWTLCVTDLDGDARPEVLAGTHTGRVLAFDADGTRRFESQASGRIFDISPCDLDADGRTDLVVRGAEDNLVGLLLHAARAFEVNSDGLASVLGCGDVDFDGDGRSDIFFGTETGRVQVAGPDGVALLGERVGGAVRTILAADLDEDRRPEILAGTADGTIHALRFDGSTVFRKQTAGAVLALVGADLDRDGRPEVLAGRESGLLTALDSRGDTLFEVRLPGGIGSYRPAGEHYAGAGLAVADLDGEGRPEILAGTDEGRILAFREGRPVFEARAGDAVTFLLAADLEGDGRAEVVAATASGSILVLEGDGSERFRRLLGQGVVALLASDLDRDGRSEIVGGRWNGKVAVFTNRGDLRLDVRGWMEQNAVVAADLAGDGRMELATGHTKGVQVFDLEGCRRFETAANDTVMGLSVADLDGDGLPEILARERSSKVVGYRIPRDDPRPGLLRTFLEALEAAERGDEEAASRGFRRAGLRWLTLDDSTLGTMRTRLADCGGSPSAARMARFLDRLRPASPVEWVQGVRLLAGRGRMQEACAMAREHLSHPPLDTRLAGDLNDLAWTFVDPAAPRPEAFELALVLAESAVAASGGRQPPILDTLAEALHANGRSSEAVVVEEEALAKCPAGHRNRSGYEASLARFRAAAEQYSSATRPSSRPGR